MDQPRVRTKVHTGTGQVTVEEETSVPGVTRQVAYDPQDAHPAINSFAAGVPQNAEIPPEPKGVKVEEKK